jgi:hypothetical protein
MLMAVTPRRRLLSEHFKDDGTPKRRFPTEAAADAFVRRMMLTQTTVTYHCSFCDGWHIATRRTPRYN